MVILMLAARDAPAKIPGVRHQIGNRVIDPHRAACSVSIVLMAARSDSIVSIRAGMDPAQQQQQQQQQRRWRASAVSLATAMCNAVGDAPALAEAASQIESMFEGLCHLRWGMHASTCIPLHGRSPCPSPSLTRGRRSIAVLTPDAGSLKYFLISADPSAHRPLGIQHVTSTAAGLCIRFKEAVTTSNFAQMCAGPLPSPLPSPQSTQHEQPPHAAGMAPGWQGPLLWHGAAPAPPPPRPGPGGTCRTAAAAGRAIVLSPRPARRPQPPTPTPATAPPCHPTPAAPPGSPTGATFTITRARWPSCARPSCYRGGRWAR
jgi:hypothetical protein